MIHGFSLCAVFWVRSGIFFVLERNGIFIWGLYTFREEVIGLNYEQ